MLFASIRPANVGILANAKYFWKARMWEASGTASENRLVQPFSEEIW